MKRCPKCNSTFMDDSLNYCLSDGTILVSVSHDTSQETLVIPDLSQIKIVKVERNSGDVLEFSKAFATTTEEKLIIHDASGKKIAEFYKNNIGDWWTETDNQREEQKKERTDIQKEEQKKEKTNIQREEQKKEKQGRDRIGYGEYDGVNDREPRW